MKAKSVAFGGLMTALSLIVLYLTLFIPTNTLTLLTVTAFLVCLTSFVSSTRTAYCVYLSTGLLSFILVPLNTTLLYTVFFGSYGCVKCWIESLNRPYLESVLKLVFLNSLFLLTYMLLNKVLGGDILAPLKTLLQTLFPTHPHLYRVSLFFLAQLGFGIFDYALTLLLDFYMRYFDKLHYK